MSGEKKEKKRISWKMHLLLLTGIFLATLIISFAIVFTCLRSRYLKKFSEQVSNNNNTSNNDNNISNDISYNQDFVNRNLISPSVIDGIIMNPENEDPPHPLLMKYTRQQLPFTYSDRWLSFLPQPPTGGYPVGQPAISMYPRLTGNTGFTCPAECLDYASNTCNLECASRSMTGYGMLDSTALILSLIHI